MAKSQIRKIRQTVIFISHDEDFLSETADTIVHLRLVKHRKEAETLVEHLDYDSYSDQRKANFIKQSQQAANDQRAYDKTMEKHRGQAKCRNCASSYQRQYCWRLLAKKMKMFSLQENALKRQLSP